MMPPPGCILVMNATGSLRATEEIVMQQLQLKKPHLSRAAFNRRADEFLGKIQSELMPKHSDEIVSINMETGEYVLGETAHESAVAYRTRWPHVLMYQCRVDGARLLS